MTVATRAAAGVAVRGWCGWALALGALVAPAAFAAEDAYAWLERMNEALATRNYDGTFFHVRDGRVETLRILHRVEEGEVHERLVSLDGSGREFIRAGAELTCILPDQRTVLVERGSSPAPLLGNLPRFDASTASFYEVEPAQRTRLMGRDARLVVVRPRDEYRYGYRLWIDEKTAMPLKTQLCDASGEAIEQIVFASLTLPAKIPDSAFKAQASTEGFRWLRHDGLVAGSGLVVGKPAAAPPAWTASRLPPGFRMTQRSAQRLPGIDRPVAHLVFSDGVASVSVFIHDVPAGRAPAAIAAGATQIGPSATYTTRVDGHFVTAVGEVPAGTVRLIASQVRPEPLAAEFQPAPGQGAAPAAAAPVDGPRQRDRIGREPARPALAPAEPGR
jgi:sigma-E factor negative regulatory protein RseB